MNKTPRQPSDYEKDLQEQYSFIRSSCKSFDNGREEEAKRLSQVLRVLLHDKGRQISLLKQMGKKDIPFYNTAHPHNKNNQLSHFGLAQVVLNAGPSGGVAKYIAPLEKRPMPKEQWDSFDTWWNEVVIDDKKNQFSRMNLVLNVCDTDGGAHIDPTLDTGYFNLSRKNSMNWFIYSDGEEKDFPAGSELASIRQIAYEMTRTLEREFKFLIP